MDQRKDANPGSPRAVYPTRVVIECSKLPNWKALSRTLPAGFQVMHRSGTIKDMLAECQRIVPCVLIVSRKSLEELDVNDFRGSVGLGGSVRVLVLDSHKSPGLGEKFLSIGCMGYLPSDVSRSALKRAVRALASGEMWADRKTLSQAFRILIAKQLAQGLTSREGDVLRLIVSGHTNRSIADRLCITHETVRWHIRSLYSKLGVQDRFSAAVLGKRLLELQSDGAPSELPNAREAQPSDDFPRELVIPKLDPTAAAQESLPVSGGPSRQVSTAKKQRESWDDTPRGLAKADIRPAAGQVKRGWGLEATLKSLFFSSLLMLEGLNLVSDIVLAQTSL